MKKYNWKKGTGSFFKGIDPNKVVKEFKKIEKNEGALTPENIVKAATSENSILHSAFEWDDGKAAKQYRLQQARVMINNIQVEVVDSGNYHNIEVYEIVKVEGEGRQYKHIETLTFNEVEQVKNQTLAALKQLTNKLKLYKEFDKVIEHLQAALLELVD